ncbi:Lateral signaling target protein 2 [Caenorhabditis elegans]|uniref:Lateral signaling target protein 2 n=8 Tax=Caenorhabditis elegans TaxID=6239 RepID=LST2_CAEEL|nr:Lateral signaling target protein 2 [Caenorhabditis elegans]Q9TZD0.2 RecName: Full=Lateral signaling target protein 2 [Caenorhabditis elegans]CCD68425.1 Lateral signaling target protein 2 [Caenorhabditis elegans]|eukprot:NP_508756.2 Lateral signaling target protein 2 [Caenorhabditis elegans]
MQSFRKIWNKPRPDDWMPLARFYYADSALNDIASELDSFDGRRDPDRCNALVTRLRVAQDRVLHIITEMLIHLYPREQDRACRDFRVKFPDEILHDTLPGQLWFGAECLSAGSNIIDHETESDLIRPLAKDVTKQLDFLRDLLKNQSLRDPSAYNPVIKENLLKFDKLFAEFEYQYVSAMVPVKSVKEHDSQLDVAVLFSEVLSLALVKDLITQDLIDYCDPSVMIAIPRLGIVWGLLVYSNGALNVDVPAENLSEMFRPFYSLLVKIRNLLRILTPTELTKLETVLCKGESAVPEDTSSTLTMSDFRTNATDEEKAKNNQRVWMCDMPSDSTSSLDSSVQDSSSETTSLASSALASPHSGSEENVSQIENEEGDDEAIGTNSNSSNEVTESPETIEEPDNVDMEESSESEVDTHIDETRNESDDEITDDVQASDVLQVETKKCKSSRLLEQKKFDKSVKTIIPMQTDPRSQIDPKNLRSRFRSSEDLVHRLFVCIAGVADQLQTNYSSEIRKVLKLILQPSEIIPVYEVVNAQVANSQTEGEETGVEAQETLPLPAFMGVRWVPDEDCEQCTACSMPFNFVRRRHHCRNCGRIFCHKCSCNTISIPEHGYDRKVRVCNLCYVHRLNSFGCNEPMSQVNENGATVPSVTEQQSAQTASASS